jgi:hypothetical protein
MADRYRALLVGNSRYPFDHDNLPTLEGPVNDVTLLRAALQDPVVGMFSEDDVTVRAEWASHELVGALDDFFSDADRSDVLLLYYSGHGRLDQTNTLYLCAHDTRTDRLRATAISSHRLNEMIEASVATRMIIILDCCHSGAFKGGDLASPLAGMGRYVLASCRARELASDASHVNRPSLFTKHLVDGLRGAEPDPGDPLTLEELHAYVRDQLTERGLQRPQLVSRGDGGLAIARRPLALQLRQQPPDVVPSGSQQKESRTPPAGDRVAEQLGPRGQIPPSGPVRPPQLGPPGRIPPSGRIRQPPVRRRFARAWLAAGAVLTLALLVGVVASIKGCGSPVLGPTKSPTPTSPVPITSTTPPSPVPTTTPPIPAPVIDPEQFSGARVASGYLVGDKATIDTKLNQLNARVIDVEAFGPDSFAVVWVDDSNPAYARSPGGSSSWTTNETFESLTAKINSQNRRPIDFERYTVNGQLRWAAAWVDNVGPAKKVWKWWLDVTPSYMDTLLKACQCRPVDVDPLGNGHYDVIMIPNTGVDSTTWWWYPGLTQTQVDQYLSGNGARPVDLKPDGSGRFAVIMVKDRISGGDVFGQPSSALAAGPPPGMRYIHISQYTSTAGPAWLSIHMKNG